MSEEIDCTRRTALKKLGAGAAALSGTVSASSTAAADTFTFTVNQYPFSAEDSEEGSYESYSGDRINYSHTWGVQIEHLREYRGEHEFAVNFSTNAMTRFEEDYDETCGAVYEQELGVEWPSSAAYEDEVVFRDNDEWIAGHTYDGGEEKTWYEEHGENFVDYLIDLGSETLGTPKEVALSTGEFLLNTYQTHTDDSNEKRYAWNYDGTNDNYAYPGANEGAAWIHFRVFVDEGEETSFTARTRHDLVQTYARGVEYEFVLEPPA